MGVLSACTGTAKTPPEVATPAPAPPWPATRRDNVQDTLFGTTLTDPYRWLEDESAPEVQAWVDAQDGYARAWLKAVPGRDALAARFQELYAVDAVSTPAMTRSRIFYSHHPPDKDKALLVWKQAGQSTEAKPGEENPERVLIDPNGWSEDGSVTLSGWVPSLDGEKVAFKKNPNNSDESTLYVIDVKSGAISDIDVIPGARYAWPVWTPDGKGFYYAWIPQLGAVVDGVTVTEENRPGYTEIRHHTLGADPAEDPLIRARTGNPSTFQGVDLSFDGRWLFVSVSHGWNANDYYIKDLKKDLKKDPKRDDVGDGFRPLIVGQPARYEVIAWKDRLYISTDEGAPRGRIFTADPQRPMREAWKELVPEDPEATLDGFSVVGGALSLSYLKDVSTRLKLVDLNGALIREIPLPTVGTATLASGLPDQDEAWFSFSTFTVPRQVYRTSVKGAGTELWAKVEIPADTTAYAVEQVFYPSKDGTKIPMFLVYRKDAMAKTGKDGARPVLLYGYGGFNVSLTPGFRSSILPWLDKGGVYAVANLRGGGEYGKEWHDSGRGMNKQNVFDDFIAAGEFLIRDGWTRPDRLAINGGSNGGLLVGAAMTQRPDLWGAVVCQVPLLDMVRYHLFGSGRTWIPEYGSAEDEAQLRSILAWSPYQKIPAPGERAVKYPPLLMMGSDHDDRVDPLHARKFTAAVQAIADPASPTLLRVERNAGHGGADKVSSAVESTADMYAFLETVLKVGR